ncbi:serine/threonine-protein kinase [Mucilaginibacter sp. E4BP6]|uniref:serine/threonine-protein kinase n=1 Tax=Mucilaginibacter sp. E4BP6 TaxID=2723089 RepID=UPI0015C6DE0F|nr:serine/threonine-protein kinase [Mucilaginibacter sp. E4BP6]NYE68021.1 serine/threonine-protein kinase [Mucilaginibacter sp. E4BP6]
MSKVFTITEGLENLGALRTGGQGSVYKGKRIGQIITAVKILPTPIHSESEEDKNYRNFINEVEKLKKVNEVPNPNVVKILNSGITESGSFPFIEMEFIEGPDLEELLKAPNEKVFTIKETIKLADQLACALSHCHKVGVKHGDIKSNNVKFNIHSGNYVLLDFGLSVMSDEQRRSSMRHAGAIEFMAPEQNEGKMLFSTDIYSYGIILYELLAGQVPFPLHDNGETARNTVMLAHMESAVPDVLHLRRQNLPQSWSKAQQEREMQVPLWLITLINHCLEKQPESRYSNGSELHEVIARGSIAEIKTEAVREVVSEVAVPAIPIAGQALNEGKMIVSTGVFAALVILLVGSLFYNAFTLLKRNNTPAKVITQAIPDSVRKPDSTPVMPAPENTNYENKRKQADSATKSTIDDVIKSEQNKAGSPDSTATDTTNNNNQN